MTPEDTVAAIDVPLGVIGALHYFDETVLANAKAAGIDGFRMYFLGRGGVLGDVGPEQVIAAFGYFNPAVVTKMWNSAKERMAPTDAATRYLDWAADLGRRRFAATPDLGPFNAAAAKVIASVDVSGLPLFAGYSVMTPPDDEPAAAMFNAIVLRELRGSVHLAAVVAAGLPSPVAHAIRRPNDGATFGWEELPPVTEDDRQLLEAADELTDGVMADHYAVLSDAERDDLIDGVLAMSAALET